MTIHLTKFGQGRALVFFHGWGFDSQIWLSIIPKLAVQYQIILVDLPGFGKSSMMNWQQFKTELLENLPMTFALVGWSMGGLFATRLILEAADRVTHIVHISSSPRFLGDDSWPGLPSESLLNFYNKLLVDKDKTLRDFAALQMKRVKIPVSPSFESTNQGLKQGLDVLQFWDFRSKLQEIHLPSCFIFGTLDSITPIKIMHTMQSAFPQFSYVSFEQAGHMPFLSHPDKFVALLEDFIR